MRSAGSTVKAVVVVYLDTVIAVVAASVFAGVLIAAAFVGFEGTGSVTRQPLARRAAFELTDDTGRAAAEALLQRVRAEVDPDPARYAFDLEEEGGSLWLVAVYRGESLPRAVTDTIRASGIWSYSTNLGTVGGFAVERMIADPIGALSGLSWLLPLVLSLGGICYAVAGWVFRRRRPVPDYEAPPPSWGSSLVVGAGLGAAGLALASVVTVLAQQLGIEGQEQTWVLELAQGNALAVASLALVAITLAPIGEELFFRGHVFRYLAAHADDRVAYAASALLFALAHLNPSAIPSYLVAGLVLAWGYQRWRCLRVPMIAHVTWNAISIGWLVLLS